MSSTPCRQLLQETRSMAVMLHVWHSSIVHTAYYNILQQGSHQVCLAEAGDWHQISTTLKRQPHKALWMGRQCVLSIQ